MMLLKYAMNAVVLIAFNTDDVVDHLTTRDVATETRYWRAFGRIRFNSIVESVNPVTGWEGVYRSMNGALAVSSTRGYVIRKGISVDAGDVHADELNLRFVRKTGNSKLAKCSYRSVPWGNRFYLIPESEMVGFCNVVNLGTDSDVRNGGSYYWVKGSDDALAKRPSGFPDVPKQFKDYLLETPIKGTIRPTNNNNSKEMSFHLAKGLKHGLLPGMVVIASNGEDFCELKIIKSDHSDAVAEFGKYQHEGAYQVFGSPTKSPIPFSTDLSVLKELH